ncbi:MAG: TusE/DsrC/DsvC family sulfur relay protein [Cellvibrionales bacterium]|nr:TusE/DsrC/DsvC family sulfur relay protein [Cellvibrionales bacterium]
MALQVAGQLIPTTREGFLRDRRQWNHAVATALAAAHGTQLSPAHWEILELLRDYCAKGHPPPAMRTLAAEIRQHLGADKSRSLYLMRLFGPSPAKMAARLAGLPRPKNCL